jgi:putative SOS response-associated peptidase YedK
MRAWQAARVCGRYAASRRPDDLAGEFEVFRLRPDAASPDDIVAPDWNVAPTKDVPAIVAEPDSDGGPPVRVLRRMRWGLVPWWADNPSIGSRHINARAETIADKPVFREAFAKRRCLLPADGYYEWYARQPYFLHRRDGRVLAMAGIYEEWRGVWTCAIVTTSAEDELGYLHDRMPLFVERERYGEWLDPATSDPAVLRALLVPAAAGQLEAYPVSTAVGNVRSSGPQLIERVATDDTLF